MTTRVLFIFAFSSLLQISSAQEKLPWDKWSWLIGEWVGESGAGQLGQGGGRFSLQKDLDGKILVRNNHAEYPATGTRPAISHNDLMIIYPDTGSASPKAIYFDNEGHVINYTTTVSDSSILLASSKIPNVPVFRLSYFLLDKEIIKVKFEMSQDGEKFMTYTEARCKRMNH